MSQHQNLITIIPEDGNRANAYLIRTTDGVTLIDPSIGPADVSGHDRESVQRLIATHGHFDHTSGASAWLERDPKLPYRMAEADFTLAGNPRANASAFFGRPTKTPRPSLGLDPSNPLRLSAEFRLTPYPTPGHTPGSVCLLLENTLPNGLTKSIALFTGDTLFATSIGRSDLPGGDQDALDSSIRTIYRLGITKQFTPELMVYPGHGRSISWHELLRINPWMRQART